MRRWNTKARLVGAALALLAAGSVGTLPAGADHALPAVVPAVLAITPSSGLVDNQSVTVATPTAWTAGGGTGMTGIYREFDQCPSSATGTTGCVPVASWNVGDATTSVTLAARLLTVSSTGDLVVTDCRSTACALRAVTSGDSGAEPTVDAEAPIAFAPAAPLRPAPVLTADPTTGLVDGQELDVSVTPFPAADGYHDATSVYECTEPIADLADIWTKCAFNSYLNVTDTTGGTATGHFAARTYVETSTGPIDCRASGATCTLVAVDAVGQLDNVALSFDPGGTVAPTLVSRFVPPTSGGFEPVEPQIFDLYGFTPNDPFTVQWCADDGTCIGDPITTGTLDGSGIGSFTFAGDAFPDSPTNPEACGLSYTLTAKDAHDRSAQGGYGIATACPIPVDPAEPSTPTTPTVFRSDRLPVTVTPNKNLGDTQQVTVTGSGFTPNEPVSIIECAGATPTNDSGRCDTSTSTFLAGRTITADAQGNVRATFTVHRTITTANGVVDCANGNVDPDAYLAGIAADPARETSLKGQGYFTCTLQLGQLSAYTRSGFSPIAFVGETFKPLPWEADAAPVAMAVEAQPTFTG